MTEIVKLDPAIVTVVQPPPEPALNHAAKTFYHRVDLIRGDSPRYLVSVASRTLNDCGWFQREFPRRLRFNTTLAALQYLLVDEPLVPLPMTTSQTSAAFFTKRHSE